MSRRFYPPALLVLLLLCGGCEAGAEADAGADVIGRPLDVSDAGGRLPDGSPFVGEEPRLFDDFGPDLCGPAEGASAVGFDVGQQLGRAVFKDCDGREVSLQQFCGADALWVFFAHGWCPHCQTTTGFMDSVWASYPERNLAAVNVLVQTGSGGVPDAESCKAWRDSFELGGTITLYDDSRASDALWDEPFTALSVFADRDQVVVRKVHSDVEAEIRQELDVLLEVAQ